MNSAGDSRDTATSALTMPAAAVARVLFVELHTTWNELSGVVPPSWWACINCVRYVDIVVVMDAQSRSSFGWNNAYWVIHLKSCSNFMIILRTATYRSGYPGCRVRDPNITMPIVGMNLIALTYALFSASRLLLENCTSSWMALMVAWIPAGDWTVPNCTSVRCHTPR